MASSSDCPDCPDSFQFFTEDEYEKSFIGVCIKFNVYKSTSKDVIMVYDPNAEKHRCLSLTVAVELLIHMTHMRWMTYESKLIEAGNVDELTKYYDYIRFFDLQPKDTTHDAYIAFIKTAQPLSKAIKRFMNARMKEILVKVGVAQYEKVAAYAVKKVRRKNESEFAKLDKLLKDHGIDPDKFILAKLQNYYEENSPK
jgi:hypothetical protein